MAHARVEDTWLFAVPTKPNRPMDVFEALRSGVDFEEATWLALGEYMDSLRSGVLEQGADDIGTVSANGSGEKGNVRI